MIRHLEDQAVRELIGAATAVELHVQGLATYGRTPVRLRGLGAAIAWLIRARDGALLPQAAPAVAAAAYRAARRENEAC